MRGCHPLLGNDDRCGRGVCWQAARGGHLTPALCAAGRERVQARGRARRLHSAYVELLDANAQELGFAERSRLQEANMHAVMAGMNAVRVG